MRLAVYTDYTYHRLDDVVYAERAFALFIDELAEKVDRLVLTGRLDPRPRAARYRLTEQVEFVPMPFYETITRPLKAWRQMLASLRVFWRVLDDVDAVWVLGPNPLALLYAVEARMRRRTVALGVRQSTREYLRSRHPTRRWIHVAGALLEGAWRLMARTGTPIVVVGPQIAEQYPDAKRLLAVAISLVREADLGDVRPRDYAGELEILSVTRIEADKNPLMLAEVLARLNAVNPRWRLTVCGEGPLKDELAQRLEQLGVADRARLRGYVPLDGGLLEAYRNAHVLLHTSWTEGLPQILFEAFAAALPAVMSDVGGTRAAVGDAVELVAPGDVDAAVAALELVAGDAARREQRVAVGVAHVRDHTLEAETARVAEFIAAAAAR
jgi:glycosyltransferase involved in cell wall biosynthesis